MKNNISVEISQTILHITQIITFDVSEWYVGYYCLRNGVKWEVSMEWPEDKQAISYKLTKTNKRALARARNRKEYKLKGREENA